MFAYMNPHQPVPTGQIGVSVKDAARLTSMSEKVVRDEVNAGRIPAVRYGTRIVIDYAGLIDWFRSHPAVVEQQSA